MSILLSSTYFILSSAATSTNKSISLAAKVTPKSRHHPEIEAAKKLLMKKHKALLKLRSDPGTDPCSFLSAKQEHSDARDNLRKTVRAEQNADVIHRDVKLFSVKSPDAAALFRAIKGNKSVSSSKIHELQVQERTYHGEAVPDGFFDSLVSLKSPDMETIHSFPHFQDTI